MTRRRDAGAVAIVVALVVTLVLIPVAALAVDLGSVYVRQGTLQDAADAAVRAGAAELAVQQRDGTDAAATMTAARARVVQALCAGVAANDPWRTACTGTPSWASDGDPANGEVSFYTGRPDPERGFGTGQGAEDALPQSLVGGIRVVTPPSRVTFGLAGTFTTNHADLQQAATAGIFTVLPRAGIFPMFLRPGESGGFCTRSAPRSVWYPTQPAGCTSVARGNLAAPRSVSGENAHALVWNAATGFDRDHLPLPGATATFQPQAAPASSLVRELAPGLFGGTGSYGAPARLKGACPGGAATTSGPFSGLESAYLTDFADPRVGDKVAFRTLVKAGTAPAGSQRGWLAPAVLRCGRLAVAPVLSGVPDPLPETGLTTLSYPVTSLRLIWLDDRLWDGESESSRVATGHCLTRGFYWADEYNPFACETALRAYTGYILDPRLLPATVTGADAASLLDRYAGAGLPATVRLVRDVTDPPPR